MHGLDAAFLTPLTGTSAIGNSAACEREMMVADVTSSSFGWVVAVLHGLSRSNSNIMCIMVPQFVRSWFMAIGESMLKSVSLLMVNGSKFWAVSPKRIWSLRRLAREDVRRVDVFNERVTY